VAAFCFAVAAGNEGASSGAELLPREELQGGIYIHTQSRPRRMTWRLKSQHGSTVLLHVARYSWRYAWTLESRSSAPHILLIFPLLGFATSTDLIRHTTSYLLHFVKIISIAVSLYLATTCSFFSFFLLPNRSPHVYSNCPIQHKLYIADIQKIISLLARGVLFTNASFCSRKMASKIKRKILLEGDYNQILSLEGKW
jgi:hypothetical protein